jgi:hypothetical protein
MNHHRHKTRRRTAVPAAIAGVVMLATVMLATGCGSSGLPTTSHGSGTPSSSPSGTGGAAGNQGSVSPPNETAGTGSRSAVTGGALFGGTSQLTAEEGRLGRRLAIVRVYYQLGQSFPTSADRQMMASGSTLLVSLDSVAGQGPSYASIAAGHEDATIGAFLRAMNQDAITYHLGAIYICFEHEADSGLHQQLGPPSEFIQAWDHVHQLAQSEHLNWNAGGRLRWVFILEHSAYFTDLPAFLRNAGGGASSYWPGTNEVDIIAADGYNHNGCKQDPNAGPTGANSLPSTTPGALFDPVLSFAQSHGGLPVFIAEWGSQTNDSSEQATFITQMQSYVSANREIAAAMYFDWHSAQTPACNSSVNNAPASLSAMAAMGHSAGLQGRVVAPS